MSKCHLRFSPEAWDQYSYWQQTDKAILKKLNRLLEAVVREPYEGIGKPEQLHGNLAGFWSRRITDEHRLVYRLAGSDIEIASCRFHYEK